MLKKTKSFSAPKQNPSCPKWLDDLENLKEKRDQLKRAYKRVTNPQKAQNSASGSRDFAACSHLRAEIKPLIVTLREAFPGLTKEELKLVDQLEKDYHTSIETLKFYDLLDAQNGTAYTSDYAEFSGQQFKVPTWPEIKARLTVGSDTRQKLAAIMEMQKKGNQPKLQLTPIGKTIRSLAAAIDKKKSQLMANQVDTYIGEDIKDKKLKYFPQEIQVGPAPLFTLTAKNTKTKEQVIKENNGWLLTISETKPEMDTNPEVADEENPDENNSTWNTLTISQKLAKYHAYQKSHHQTGLTYEDYLIAQMAALKTGQPLEKQKMACLNGSMLSNASHVPCGDWDSNQVLLGGGGCNLQDDDFQVRSSVRF